MKKMIFMLISALTLVLSNPAGAIIDQTNATVTFLGVEGDGTRVVVVISPNPSNCPYSAVYFKDPIELNPSLSIALAAKLADKKIRITFTQPDGAGTICLGYSIYVT